MPTPEEFAGARRWLAKNVPQRYSPEMTDEEVTTLLFELMTEMVKALAPAFEELKRAVIAAARAIEEFGQAYLEALQSEGPECSR
jgi:hypothetical protein